MKQGDWNPWWYGVVICALVGVISLFHINSYWSEKVGNWPFIVSGVLLLGLALWFLKKTKDTSKGTPG